MRFLFAAALAALALASSASAAVAPVVEDPNGGTPWTCRWNSCAEWNGVWWVGEFQWYDGMGNTTGVRCA